MILSLKVMLVLQRGDRMLILFLFVCLFIFFVMWQNLVLIECLRKNLIFNLRYFFNALKLGFSTMETQKIIWQIKYIFFYSEHNCKGNFILVNSHITGVFHTRKISIELQYITSWNYFTRWVFLGGKTTNLKGRFL